MHLMQFDVRVGERVCVKKERERERAWKIEEIERWGKLGKGGGRLLLHSGL